MAFLLDGLPQLDQSTLELLEVLAVYYDIVVVVCHLLPALI